MKTDYDVDGDQVLSQSLFPLSLKVTTKQKKFGTAAQRLESVSHATNQPTIEITFHRQKNYSMNSDFSVFSSKKAKKAKPATIFTAKKEVLRIRRGQSKIET